MLNFNNVYLISIKKMLKKPSFYFIGGAGFLTTFIIMVFIPAISLGGISTYYENDIWTHLVFASFIVVIAIFSAIFGELNAINSEKIYFLSKPIKRSTFLFAKCLASFTLAILVAFICSLILLVIALVEYVNNREVVFKTANGNNAASIFISFLIICFFSSICSTIWTYFFRQGYSAILFAGLVLIYAILFPLVAELDRGDLTDHQRLLWVTLPIGIYLFLTAVFVLIGSWLFMKSEIES